jgi:hypothetical protein
LLGSPLWALSPRVPLEALLPGSPLEAVSPEVPLEVALAGSPLEASSPGVPLWFLPCSQIPVCFPRSPLEAVLPEVPKVSLPTVAMAMFWRVHSSTFWMLWSWYGLAMKDVPITAAGPVTPEGDPRLQLLPGPMLWLSRVGAGP